MAKRDSQDTYHDICGQAGFLETLAYVEYQKDLHNNRYRATRSITARNYFLDLQPICWQ
jgi:hypothetical protein